MANNGVSHKFKIDGAKFKSNPYGSVKRYSAGGAVAPPVVSVVQGKISSAILKWVNPYPDIAFEKIILPYFDGISQYTTQISNDPDFIKDYHFISLMRCIDLYNSITYSGIITSTRGGDPQFTGNK